MQESVFLLWHTHVVDGVEDDKLIGVYSTKAFALEAKMRMLKQPGFKLFTDGFTVDCYTIDEDNWSEGFVTVSH